MYTCNIIILCIEYDRRQSFLSTLNCEHGSPHLVARDDIYNDVLKLYANFNELVNEYPFRIAFDDEEALDTGGVCRDMFSGFWKTVCDRFFDGSGSLVPATHPNVDMGALPIIGTVLSHGYIVSGFLPVQICFPVLAAILLGPTIQIEDSLLCQSFINHLNYYDSSIIKEAFLEQSRHQFSPNIHSRILALLAGFDSRKVPSPANLKSTLVCIARHEFLVKPLGAIYAINGGIPAQHRSFWRDMKLECFLKVYLRATASVSSVLGIIIEPPLMDASQSVVYGYLRKYVGNMKNSEVRDFLRFVTGSSALIVDEISVTFNGLSGLSRRPVAHTCTPMLELPTTYETLVEFSQEFDALLSSELSWIMDAI